VGVDLTPEMVELVRKAAAAWTMGPVEVHEASVEALPLADASFDIAISNGALNLVPDKDAAFSEIARVLRPGGTFAAADLVVLESLPEEVACRLDAWSG
jgi:ubiquinone/menaquinone biosynthesis C-methylase UbiE